jgi:hypothetical protein
MKSNESTSDNRTGIVVLNLAVGDDCFEFDQSISTALLSAEAELDEIEDAISETEDKLKKLTPECDKIDYLLSAASGALCGIIDIFLVGKPGQSPLGDITDKWFADRTKAFAKLCKWDNSKDASLKSAIKYLENKFKIPYDQSVGGSIFHDLLNLTPDNHHFKSLGHNPTLLGLFFSILNQFMNTSSFVSEGELITLKNSDGKFELEGHNIPSKLFCGLANWIGHLISDISGSSGSKGRGMGIPSPIWSWMNDIIAIKRKLGIPASEFDKATNELAIQVFREGYDARFQTAQAIPVFVNEITVRLFYGIRRAIRYFSITAKEDRSFKMLWKACEPFSNATVKRMLTVAHGAFCLVDISDATIRGFATGGGYFNVAEFFMRLNIVGVGRFTVSLYGEARRGIKRLNAKEDVYFFSREKLIVENYMNGLHCLSEIYDDKLLLTFIDDLKNSDAYIQAFHKSAQFAEKRNVPDKQILKTKADIDQYFLGGNIDG